MPKTAIIIPCYNEANRIKSQEFKAFLNENAMAYIIFVNDGSTDTTHFHLSEIAKNYPNRVSIITLTTNKGKAFAVKEGFVSGLKKAEFDYIGFLDADLSTSFTEYQKILNVMTTGNYGYAFGSRIKLLGAGIERKLWRHFTGRFIATIIDGRFNLGIYDTQCGAKIFSRPVAAKVFQQPFCTRWLFDVEIFLRIRTLMPFEKGIEIPLNKWKENKGSKLSLLSSFLIAGEIIKLYRLYKK